VLKSSYVLEVAEQEREGVGWCGPVEWPDVRMTKVAPFASLSLTRINCKFDRELAEQLPRAVASASFFGKPRFDFVCVKVGEGEDCHDWIGQVVMFFMASQVEDDENECEWEELAYVRWLRDVQETDFQTHSRGEVRNESQVIWKRIGHANTAGIKMMCWEEMEKDDFSPWPHTTGWQVISCETISHRVLMQGVNHAHLEGYYWMNPSVYR
jgi:hypothetical protein